MVVICSGPVGTMWIISFIFTFLLGNENNNNNNTAIVSEETRQRAQRYQKQQQQRRYFLLQIIWISFVPTLFVLLPPLFYSTKMLIDIRFVNPNTIIWDDVYQLMNFCHVLYLCLVPIYYVSVGDLSVVSTFSSSLSSSKSITTKDSTAATTANNHNTNTIQTIASSKIGIILCQQLIGTTILTLYYFGIITPASIIVGLNVNGMLVPINELLHPLRNYDINFRLKYIRNWFFFGLLYRLFLWIVIEFVMRSIVVSQQRKYYHHHRNNAIDNINFEKNDYDEEYGAAAPYSSCSFDVNATRNSKSQ